MSEEDVPIFLKSKQFLDGVHELNSAKEEEVINLFQELCVRDDCVKVSKSESLRWILREILDRVAYFPLRPADMKSALLSVGLKESLSVKLSETWSQYARTVVNRRKTVNSDLKEVRYEILTDIVTGDERVRLNLRLTGGDGGRPSEMTGARSSEESRVSLSSSPASLFSLFDQLETVQRKIDKLCS